MKEFRSIRKKISMRSARIDIWSYSMETIAFSSSFGDVGKALAKGGGERSYERSAIWK